MPTDNEQLQKYVTSREQERANTRALLEQAQKSQPMDFSPLAAYVDAQTGSNLAASSRPLYSQGQKEQLIQGYQGMLNKFDDQAEGEHTKQRQKDERSFERGMLALNTTGRGTKYARDLRQDVNTLTQALDQVNQYEDQSAQGRPLSKQAALDLSFLISRLISGGVPAQGLVEATMYRSLGGDAASIVQYLKKDPQQYYSTEQVTDIKKQLQLLERNKKGFYNEFREGIKASMKHVVDKPANEDLKDTLESMYGQAYELGEKAPKAAKEGALALGTVEEGYEYIGGPEDKPESWRQVQ